MGQILLGCSCAKPRTHRLTTPFPGLYWFRCHYITLECVLCMNELFYCPFVDAQALALRDACMCGASARETDLCELTQGRLYPRSAMCATGMPLRHHKWSIVLIVYLFMM